MSSIFIGERGAEDSASPSHVPVSVDRRLLSRSSRLRNNVARAGGAAGAVGGVQILHKGRPVLVMPQNVLAGGAATGAASLSFTGEIALEQLPPGRYILQTSASGRDSKKGISQQTDFIVE